MDDSPNVPDHDSPGYLLIPSGYMRLLNNSSDSEYIEEVESYTEQAVNDIFEGYVNSNQSTQETESHLPVVDSMETHTINEVGSIATMVGNVSAIVGPVSTTVASVSATVGPIYATVSVTLSPITASLSLPPCVSIAFPTSVILPLLDMCMLNYLLVSVLHLFTRARKRAG